MKNTSKKGFTLVELVIVIAVIAILAAVLIPTFTSVIGRANQSAALQKWKAIVDEAYVEYVAEEHSVPLYVVKNGSTVEFKKTSFTGAKSLTTVKYTAVDTTTKLNAFLTLDSDNGIYFIWNASDMTYAVVSTNVNLGSEDVVLSQSGEPLALDAATTLATLTYGNVTYYGAVVE